MRLPYLHKSFFLLYFCSAAHASKLTLKLIQQQLTLLYLAVAAASSFMAELLEQ